MSDAGGLLLISGSLRGGSTNTAVLRTVATIVTARLHKGLDTLPHFNPDDDTEGAELHPAVSDLRGSIHSAEAILISTPEYAGGLPGSFKNLLDWTVGGGEIYTKPVAWFNVSSVAAPTGGADAHGSLRKVLTYAGATIIEAACLRMPVGRDAVGPDGLIADPELRARMGAALDALR